MRPFSASFLLKLVLASFVCAFLGACSTRYDVINKTASRFFLGEEDLSTTTSLNPNVRYLRVQINGRVVLLVLGYVDTHPLGPIEVWYSAKGEVLRLQNGHLAGLTGAAVEWRDSRLSNMPVWPTANSLPSTYTRSRDVMPGYRFGVVDQLSLRAVTAPARSNLVAVAATQLRWFEELEVHGALPPSRFALLKNLGQDVAVYGEQCISAAVCLSWQQWPPAIFALRNCTNPQCSATQ